MNFVLWIFFFFNSCFMAVISLLFLKILMIFFSLEISFSFKDVSLNMLFLLCFYLVFKLESSLKYWWLLSAHSSKRETLKNWLKALCMSRACWWFSIGTLLGHFAEGGSPLSSNISISYLVSSSGLFRFSRKKRSSNSCKEDRRLRAKQRKMTENLNIQ